MKKALIIAATGGFLKGFLVQDMKILQEMGYEVHCAANADAVKTFVPNEFFASIGVTFHQIDFSSTSPFSKSTIRAYSQVKQLLKEHGFDFIHCHTPIPGAIVRIAAILYRLKKCKVVYTTHGLNFPKGASKKDKFVYGGIEWLCSWLSDAIITINREDYNAMQRMACRKVFYINGVGVDTDKYHNVSVNRAEYRKELGFKEDDIVVLSVGELSVRKNHKVIIRAIKELNDSRYVYAICGKQMTGMGTYDMLNELSRELGVRVIFLGFRSDIPEICHCADIAAIPSLREGLGLAGIEALASGVPVIGSDVQGIKDYVIDGETGYLCQSTNYKEFAEKIRVLSDSAIRESMKEKCISKAEEFNFNISHNQMRLIYNEVLS